MIPTHLLRILSLSFMHIAFRKETMKKLILLLMLLPILSSCGFHIAYAPTYHIEYLQVSIVDELGNVIEPEEGDYLIEGDSVLFRIKTGTNELLWFLDGNAVSPLGNGDSYSLHGLSPGSHSIVILFIGDGDYEIGRLRLNFEMIASDTEIVEGAQV